MHELPSEKAASDESAQDVQVNPVGGKKPSSVLSPRLVQVFVQPGDAYEGSQHLRLQYALSPLGQMTLGRKQDFHVKEKFSNSEPRRKRKICHVSTDGETSTWCKGLL